MRDGENSRNISLACFFQRKLQQLPAEAAAAQFRTNGKRTNFCKIFAVAFEGHASGNAAFGYADEKLRDALANIRFAARKQNPFGGILRNQCVNRRSIREPRAPHSHDFFSATARRSFADSRPFRTAAGAVPPIELRRAKDASGPRAVAKSTSKAGEYAFNFSIGHSRKGRRSFSLSRTSVPTISCACRNGTPLATR